MKIPAIHNEEEEDNFMEGYLLFLPFALGSKSEGVRPYMVRNMTPSLMLYRDGDNPMTNDSLRPFHTKFCRVRAKTGKMGTHLVEEIEILEDPMTVLTDKNPPPLNQTTNDQNP